MLKVVRFAIFGTSILYNSENFYFHANLMTDIDGLSVILVLQIIESKSVSCDENKMTC